jgi:hypothetical protein
MSDALLAYIGSLPLPDPMPQLESAQSLQPPGFGSGPELVAVAAQLAEFSAAVAPAQRAVVADCLLLAQLAADKATSMNDDLPAWYDAYARVLRQLGWLQTTLEFKETTVTDQDAGVHRAIIPVLTAMLGPAAAAASMVVTVLDGLQQMDADSPWITLFDRSSSHARGAKFQLGFVDADESMVTVRLVALALDARRRLTQVLFFKFADEQARLSVSQGELGVGIERLQGIAAAVAAKVAPHLVDHIGRIEI